MHFGGTNKIFVDWKQTFHSRQIISYLESYDFDLGGLLKKMIKKLPILSKKKYVTILAVSRILKPLAVFYIFKLYNRKERKYRMHGDY